MGEPTLKPQRLLRHPPPRFLSFGRNDKGSVLVGLTCQTRQRVLLSLPSQNRISSEAHRLSFKAPENSYCSLSKGIVRRNSAL